jgi:hypothetical protein
MTTHPSKPTADTQCSRILDRLERAKGRWVSLPELSRISGAYAVHSRISDLRARGHAIPRPRLKHKGRTICSAYRLDG